jgi:ribosomal protein S18 acetylase RimI-like enzyme/quercetin dioxygenase-like cupin family protein
LNATDMMKIRAFKPSDEAALVALWQACGLTRPWNDPHADIARKLTQQPELFLVGTVGAELVASAMVGFDGHRGWVYYLAVAPAHRRQSHGRALMREAERLLTQRGCPKLNLQLRASNAGVIEFYRKLGYVEDDLFSLGKRLIHDQAASPSDERAASKQPAAETHPVRFDALPWQSTMPGARFKVFGDGRKQMRLVEFTSEFVEPHWCEKGHVGWVLEGELEVDFRGRVVRYAAGSGIFIAAGPASAHKARAVTPAVRLFLVEDV